MFVGFLPDAVVEILEELHILRTVSLEFICRKTRNIHFHIPFHADLQIFDQLMGLGDFRGSCLADLVKGVEALGDPAGQAFFLL